ncbi:MAG: peptidoglycan editing factor PgeF [Myxococcales bacterium]|nr:peptidoglycan editing factor PgeF [Myxococcales bacterium]
MGILRSRLLAREGFDHGSSLRTGGQSAPPFDSLNLGRGLGDDEGAVRANHERMAARAGYRPERLFEVSQVHGTRVREVSEAEEPPGVRAEEADGLLAGPGGLAIGVRTADCVPLLLADPERGVVAAVHAGWRGIEAGIAPLALQSLAARGARPDRMIACIFPHICPRCFEIGEDVATRLVAAAGGEGAVIRREAGRPRADLSAILRLQLLGGGIDPAHVEEVQGCTFEDSSRFFSFRRDGGQTGRHLTVIVSRR